MLPALPSGRSIIGGNQKEARRRDAVENGRYSTRNTDFRTRDMKVECGICAVPARRRGTVALRGLWNREAWLFVFRAPWKSHWGKQSGKAKADQGLWKCQEVEVRAKGVESMRGCDCPKYGNIAENQQVAFQWFDELIELK